MRKLMTVTLIILLNSSAVWADSTWAVLRQTAIQTSEHIKRVQEAVKTVRLLQSQVQDTQSILQLAEKAAKGI
ncbi:MAG: hypothetical protein KAS66_14920, partial [Candidatus Omnitrophica bacterium]|nr:hypothetical protein [Candidatus Omnitrophota bacterium]